MEKVVTTVRETAVACGVTDRRVRQLMADFGQLYEQRGLIDFTTFAANYIARLRAGQTEKPADARLKSVKADEIDARISERRRDLIPSEDAETALANVLGFIEDAAAGAGGRATLDRATAGKVDDEISRTVTEARERAGRVTAALKRGLDPREVL